MHCFRLQVCFENKVNLVLVKNVMTALYLIISIKYKASTMVYTYILQFLDGTKFGTCLSSNIIL